MRNNTNPTLPLPHSSNFLSHGKLTAQVPPQAAGFTIATPTLTAIDLGTEFGVVVRDQGTGVGDQGKENSTVVALTSEVHVLSGQVEVAANSNSEIGVPATAGHLKSEIIPAGHAVRIDTTGTVQPAAAAPDAFLEARALLNRRSIVVDDDFDDGDIERNTHGVGTGFDTILLRVPFNNIGENDGTVRMYTVNGGRLSRNEQLPVWIIGRDRFAADGARVEWRLKAAQSPAVVLALHGEDTSQSGLELRILAEEGPAKANTLVLSAWSQTGQRVEYLRKKCDAAPSGQPWDWTRDVTLTLALSRDGYEVAWKSPDGSGQTWTGKWGDQSGFDFAQFAGTSGQVHMQLHPEPTRRQGSHLQLDRVIVTVPATTAGGAINVPR